MAATQLPFDLKILQVIAYRHKWMLVILTFTTFAFSALITRSMINLYSASTTIFVDQENLLSGITQGVAVTSTLKDQLSTLRPQILSDDFIEPHVIQELNIRLADIFIPPARLKFMPDVLEMLDELKDAIKELFGLPVYTQTAEQKQVMQNKQIAAIVKNGITLRQSRGRLLQISYAGPNPTACRKIVEIIANQSKELLLRSKNQETRAAVRYIERQYQDANQRLETLEQQLAEMRVKHFADTPEAKIALLQQRQTGLDTLRVLQRQIEDIHTTKEAITKKQTERRQELLQEPELYQQLLEMAQSREARTLETKRAQLAELLTVYTEQYPVVITLKEDITALEDSMKARGEEADTSAKEKIFLADPVYYKHFSQIQDMEQEEFSLQTRLRNLQENIGTYEEKLKNMSTIEKSFAAIQREIDLHADLQVDLATRRETARATMQLEKQRGENRIRIVGRAYPDQPIGLSPILIMAALSMLGPGLGIGIIFLLYYTNMSVKGVADVQVEYNLPVIAIIPKTNFTRELKRRKKLRKRRPKPRFALLNRVKQLTRSSAQVSPAPLDLRQHSSAADMVVQHIEHPEIEVSQKMMKRVPIPNIQDLEQLSLVTMLSNPGSQAAEEYRRLGFNVEWGLKESLSGPCKTVMLTSALPNEGKTLTAINLAVTLAKHHKVLLVDLNFRKPAIHTTFGIPAEEPGISDFLEDTVTPRIFVPPGSSNLSILPAGMALSHPADLLSSKQMQQFIDSVKGSAYFEYAILDVPPVSFIPDTPIIASKLDGIVWVLWELNTSKEIIRTALTRVTNPAILGVVLNRSEQRALPKKFDKVWRDYQRSATRVRQEKS